MIQSRLPVSVVVLTQNEESNLPACLESIVGWVGQVIVLDSGSTDKTLDIAHSFGATIAEHPFENYSAQRNWAQKNLPLAFPWILHLDADERVTAELAESIQQFFTNGDADRYDGAIASRRTVFWGRPILHGGHYPAYHLRLFRRDKGSCENRLYDQHFVVEGPTTKLDGDLIDVISSDLTVWTMRHARWGLLEAQEQVLKRHDKEGDLVVTPSLTGNPIERRRWLRTSFYGRAPLFLRAFAYFLYRYFFRLGFLDGTEGLVFHCLQGLWFRFYIDAKIFELRHWNSSPSEKEN